MAERQSATRSGSRIKQAPNAPDCRALTGNQRELIMTSERSANTRGLGQLLELRPAELQCDGLLDLVKAASAAPLAVDPQHRR